MNRYLTKEHIEAFLDAHLDEFDFPPAYLGNEAGVIPKEWSEDKTKWCIIGGASYLNLSGNLACGLITQMINETTDGIAHRAFFPGSPKEIQKFEKNGIPIFSLEDKRPIWEYDIIGCSCSFPGTDFNIMKMLLMTGMDPWAKNRKEEDPIILRGGSTFSQIDNFIDMYDLIYMCFGS